MSISKLEMPKIGRRFFIPALIVCVLAVMLSIGFAGAQTQTAHAATITFKDVTTKTANYKDINWMAQKKIFTGNKVKGKYYFKPTKNVTRAEMAVMLHKMAGLYGIKDDVCTKKASFADVKSSTANRKDILWLAKSGIFTGDKVGKKTYFYPNRAVKRHELAAALYNLADLANDGLMNENQECGTDVNLKFSDVYQNSPHAKEICWFAFTNIHKGWKNKKTGTYAFRLNQGVKRQEMANYLHRFDNQMMKWYYFAAMEIKGYGTITLALDKQQAPITSKNFVKVAKAGVYNGSTFTRAVKDFIIQGGGISKDYKGKTPETITGEFTSNLVMNYVSHTRRAISMARASESYTEGDIYGYNTASTQFFIVQKDSTGLNGRYAAFGYVVSGMNIVDKVMKKYAPKTAKDSEDIPTKEQPVITSVTVRES